MANEGKQEKKKGGEAPAAGKSKGGKGGERQSMLAKGPHGGRDLPVPPPRLRDFYRDTVHARLMKKFELSNAHQVPMLEKIVLNVGLGEALKQPKLLDSVVEELALITGQRAVRKKAKKSISN